MMFKNKYDMYDNFLRECWSKHINDNLISCIVPMDNTTVSKYRKEIKVCANGQTTSKPMIARAFEVLEKPEYRFIFETMNPLRTESNVKFWETGTAKRDNLFDYFMLLRQKLCNKIVEENNKSRTDDSVQMSFEDLPNEHLTEDVKGECVIETVPEAIEHAAPCTAETKECTKEDIKQMLKKIIEESTKLELYNVVHDVVNILDYRFRE